MGHGIKNNWILGGGAYSFWVCSLWLYVWHLKGRSWEKLTSTATIDVRSWFLCEKDSKSCPTLCDPIDCSPSGSSVYGISQARILEWVAISFSRGSVQPRDQNCVSCNSSALQADSLPLSPRGNLLLWGKKGHNHNSYFQTFECIQLNITLHFLNYR